MNWSLWWLFWRSLLLILLLTLLLDLIFSFYWLFFHWSFFLFSFHLSGWFFLFYFFSFLRVNTLCFFYLFLALLRFLWLHIISLFLRDCFILSFLRPFWRGFFWGFSFWNRLFWWSFFRWLSFWRSFFRRGLLRRLSFWNRLFWWSFLRRCLLWRFPFRWGFFRWSFLRRLSFWRRFFWWSLLWRFPFRWGFFRRCLFWRFPFRWSFFRGCFFWWFSFWNRLFWRCLLWRSFFWWLPFWNRLFWWSLLRWCFFRRLSLRRSFLWWCFLGGFPFWRSFLLFSCQLRGCSLWWLFLFFHLLMRWLCRFNWLRFSFLIFNLLGIIFLLTVTIMNQCRLFNFNRFHWLLLILRRDSWLLVLSLINKFCTFFRYFRLIKLRSCTLFLALMYTFRSFYFLLRFLRFNLLIFWFFYNGLPNFWLLWSLTLGIILLSLIKYTSWLLNFRVLRNRGIILVPMRRSFFWFLILLLIALRMMWLRIIRFLGLGIFFLWLLIEVVFILLRVFALFYSFITWLLFRYCLRSLWLGINKFRLSFSTSLINGTRNLWLLWQVTLFSVSRGFDLLCRGLLRFLGNLGRLFWPSMYSCVALFWLIQFFMLLLSWFRLRRRNRLFCLLSSFLLGDISRSIFKFSRFMPSRWLLHALSKSIWTFSLLTRTPTSLPLNCWFLCFTRSGGRISC